MDPLSDVLSLLKPRSYLSGGFEVSGDVAIQFPKPQGIKCYAVFSGQCWLSVEGVPDAVLLTTGDCYVLPRGLSFRLATDLSLTPVDFKTLLSTRRLGGADSSKEGSGCYLVGGQFALTGSHADILLSSLPPIVHIRKESDKAAMRWSLERMKEELRDPQSGGSLIAQQLAYVMLVQALRLHLADGARQGVGWLFALADKQMSAAIASMHDDPGHPWTLQKLAGRVGMSRSIFALKFKDTVGATPMEYLTAEGTIPLQLYGYEAGLPWCRKDGQEFPEGLRHEKGRQYREGINGQHLLRECCRCRRQDHRAHAARFGPAAIFELPVDSPPGRPNAEGPIACKARLSTLYASGYLVDCNN